MTWNQEPKIRYTELFINNSCIIINKRHEKITGLKQKKNPRVQTKTHVNPNQQSALTPTLQSLGGCFRNFFPSGPMTSTSAGGMESAAISHRPRD